MQPTNGRPHVAPAREPARVFTPDYAYVVDTATTGLSADIRSEAGPRTTCP